MSRTEIVERPLPAVRLAARLAARTVEVSGQGEVPAVVGPLFDRVAELLSAMGASLQTPIAAYEMSGEKLLVIVGYQRSGSVPKELETVDLPAVPAALCMTHYGSMAEIGASWQALWDEVSARGLRPAGPSREVYLQAASEDQADWVTELQLPVSQP